MKIIGVDEQSRQGQVLKNELKKVGFRLSELEFVADIPDDEEGWYMVFGSPALSEFCNSARMSDVSGQLLHCAYNEKALIIPNYAPGFLYHNPHMKGLWVANLENAYVLWTLDTKGVIA